MVELQRQLILDPDAIPEPPADDEGALRPIVLRFSAVMGLAALIAWGVVSIPGMKKASDIIPPDVKAPAMTVDPAKDSVKGPAKSADRVQAQATDAAPTVNEGSSGDEQSAAGGLAGSDGRLDCAGAGHHGLAAGIRGFTAGIDAVAPGSRTIGAASHAGTDQ